MKTKTILKTQPILALIAFAGLHLLSPSARAATYTWTGASSNNWATITNWSPNNSFPISGYTGTDLVVQIDSRSTAITSSDNVTAALSINQLNFGTGTGTAAVTLTVASGAAPLNFVASGSTGPAIVQNSGASVNINGTGTVGVGGITLQNNLTVTGTGTGQLSLSTIISGTGGLNFNATGLVALNGNNTFSGGVTVSSGTVQLATGSPTVLGSGTLTMAGGKVMSASSTQKVMNNAVKVNAAATATFGDTTNNGALTFNGAASLGAGAKVIAESNVLFQNSSISLGGNVTFAQKGNARITLNNLNAAGGVTFDLALGGSPLTITNALTNTDGSTINFVLTGGTTGTVYTLLNFASTTIDYSQLQLTSDIYALDTSFGTGGWLINGNNLQVQLVPEPSTLGIAIAGLSAFGLLVLRGRKDKNLKNNQSLPSSI